jgi:hypothetical protein
MADGTVHLNIIFRGVILAVIPKAPEHAVGKPALNTLDGFERGAALRRFLCSDLQILA